MAPLEEEDAGQEEEFEEITVEDEEDAEPLRAAKDPKLPSAADANYMIATTLHFGTGVNGAISAAGAAYLIDTCVGRWCP